MTERIYGTVLLSGSTLEGKVHCPVTNLIDINGEDTDNLAEAYTAVVKVREDKWLVFVVEPNLIRPLA